MRSHESPAAPPAVGDHLTSGSTHSRPGRKPDRTKDAALMDAAVQVVTEVGYDAMTMELVAARAGTTKSAMYRRWASKGELTLDAVVRLQEPETDLGDLPDSGTLRGDLLELTRPYASEAGRRKLRLLSGLSSLLDREPALLDAAHAAIVEPWVDVCRLLIERAIDRGEAATDDLETVARVIPAMTAARVLVERRPVDREFFVRLIDGLLLPAVRRSAPTR